MPGNKNKTQVGSRAGGENKRRSGEVDVPNLRGREYYLFPC